jgi:hypothetical protein
MNREEVFAKLAPFDEDGLRTALWNLYWRGSAPLRERIEGELDPAERDRRKSTATQPAAPDWVLYEVREFTELARAGAYIAGDRRVSPKERTRWRVTFRRLAADAQSALRAEDPGPAEERRPPWPMCLPGCYVFPTCGPFSRTAIWTRSTR